MSTAPILNVNNIEVIYDHVILVLKGVSLSVPRGKIVALLGANGAGKSTTLKSISTLLRGERGDVTKGSINFEGERIDLRDIEPGLIDRIQGSGDPPRRGDDGCGCRSDPGTAGSALGVVSLSPSSGPAAGGSASGAGTPKRAAAPPARRPRIPQACQ
mgnify:CR=1 FL=1